MSNAGAPDVLSGFGDVPADNLRESAAVIVKGSGASIEEVNAALAARGVPPLNENSIEFAQGQKDALIHDSNFMARYSACDPAAIAQLYKADLAIANGKGALLDRVPSSDDERYGQLRNVVYSNVQGEAAGVVADNVAAIAASLHLDSENAKSMAELSYAADHETANMTEDQRATWGDWQLESLKSALGPDAENKLKVASDIISRVRGIKTDVAATVRESGARIGLQLISVAQVQAHKNKW